MVKTTLYLSPNIIIAITITIIIIIIINIVKQIVNHIMALTPAMDIAARRFWPPSGWTPRAGEAVHTIYVLLLLLLPSHTRS